ncbi:hypothetical protein F4774DRAFT_426500 [Daldinia eschscholtzii]|nr:hypothetical protein F4774DRAFT_426500 [Daldinia eschscholtzii]
MSGNVHTTQGPGQNNKPGDNNQTPPLSSGDGSGSSSQSPATTTNTGLENTSARPVKRRRNNDSDGDDVSGPATPLAGTSARRGGTRNPRRAKRRQIGERASSSSSSSRSSRGCFAAVCNQLVDLDGSEHLDGTDAEIVFGGIYEDTPEGLERLARAAVPEEMRDEEEEEEEVEEGEEQKEG